MFSDAFREAEANAVALALSGGSLRLYAGRRLLAELRLGGFSIANGKLTASPIPEVIALASGDAARGEVLDASGVVFCDGTVGKEIVLNISAVERGATVRCRSLTVNI